jgi:hypothetical protein
MNKSELSKVYLEKRRVLRPNYAFEKSRQLADGFFLEFDLKANRNNPLLHLDPAAG